MNNQSSTASLYSYSLLLTLLLILSIPSSYADDDDCRTGMGMGYGHMGQGYMGYGNMGPGHMGYGNMGAGHMGYGNMGSGRMGMGYGLFRNLDLTDQQRTNIRKIHKDMRAQKYALKDKISEYSDKLYSLYKEDKPNAKKIGAVYKNIFDIKQQQIELAIDIQNKTYDVLNNKQKEQLKELKSSAMDHRTGMYGRGMHRMME